MSTCWHYTLSKGNWDVKELFNGPVKFLLACFGCLASQHPSSISKRFCIRHLSTAFLFVWGESVILSSWRSSTDRKRCERILLQTRPVLYFPTCLQFSWVLKLTGLFKGPVLASSLIPKSAVRARGSFCPGIVVPLFMKSKSRITKVRISVSVSHLKRIASLKLCYLIIFSFIAHGLFSLLITSVYSLKSFQPLYLIMIHSTFRNRKLQVYFQNVLS